MLWGVMWSPGMSPWSTNVSIVIISSDPGMLSVFMFSENTRRRKPNFVKYWHRAPTKHVPFTEIKLTVLLLILTLLCLEMNDLISIKLLKSSNTDGTTYWQCTDCHYKSSHKATIKRHVESKHLEAVYQCDMCQHQVSTKHQLNAHRSLKHGSEYVRC